MIGCYPVGTFPVGTFLASLSSSAGIVGGRVVQAYTTDRVVNVMQRSNSTVASSRPRIFIARR